MLVEGGDFEIHRTYTNASILIASSSLYEKWKIDGILYNVDPFKKTRISETDYYYFKSDKQFLLGLVRHGNPFSTRRSATTFSFILKQMRKVTSISLFDGIYIEEFGYILPTYTSDSVSDDALLGTYLSGGQAKHFSDGKINALMLNEADYDEIARIIGIAIAKEEPQEGEKPIKVKGARFSLVGRPELEKFFNEHIVAILDEPERYKKLGIDFPSSIVLYGPPDAARHTP